MSKKLTIIYNIHQWECTWELLFNHTVRYYMNHFQRETLYLWMKGFQTCGRQIKYTILYMACHNVGGYILKYMEHPLKLMESDCVCGAEQCLGQKRKRDVGHCIPDSVFPSV